MEIKKALYIKKQYQSGIGYVPTFCNIRVIKNFNGEMSYKDFAEHNNKLIKEYIPKPGDKLYFLPGCTVPRFKMKTFCEKYNTSMVKNKNSATALFIQDDIFEKMIVRTPSSCVYKKADILQYFQDCLSDLETFSLDALELLKNSDCDIVFADNGVASFINKAYFNAKNYETIEEEIETYSLCFTNEDMYITYINLLNSSNIYFQTDILKRINTGAIMNEEQYISIQRLFESPDNQNHKVALEIMSNCDYENSCLYLLLLIQEYYDTIYSCPTKNHVNFKSLLKFFGFHYIPRLNLDDIIDSLISRKLLSKANLDTLMPIAIEKLSAGYRYNYFVVDKIKVSEAVEKALEENILDQAKDTQIIPEPDEELNPTI